MRILVTGGSGVLGRTTIPLLQAAGHVVDAPGHRELDLFDVGAVAAAVARVDGILHLATRIPPPAHAAKRGAWEETNRLRAVGARLLVDAALAARAEVHVQPSVGFPGPWLEAARTAERETHRMTRAGRRGVVLRLGLLYGPRTGLDAPDLRFGPGLHVDRAAEALVAAIEGPAGMFVVADDKSRERVGVAP